VLHAALCKYRTQKSPKFAIWAPSHNTNLSDYIFATKGRIDNRKNLLNSDISPIRPYNMVNFGPLAAEIRWQVWGTRADFNGFRVLAALLHSTLVVGVSQPLRRWTEGATYIRHSGHHVGHWPAFYLIDGLIPCHATRRTSASTDGRPLHSQHARTLHYFDMRIHLFSKSTYFSHVCQPTFSLLRLPCVADAGIIFLPCGFYLSFFLA